MVIEIDTAHDTPAEIEEKICQAAQNALNYGSTERRASKLAAFGQVKWEEDALEYQKRMRDEWA